MNKLKIAVLSGDGIGQCVTKAVLPVFNELDINTELTHADIGWESWKSSGNPIPDKTWSIIEQSDAVLLGATTSKPLLEAEKALPERLQNHNINYTSPLIQLRQKLNLFANIRPCFNIKNSSQRFNFVIIRENTEGLYAGFDYAPVPDSIYSLIKQSDRYVNTKQEDISCSLRLQTRSGLKNIFKYAFDYASQHNFTRVTFADKPNVLRQSSNFAREIFEGIAADYPYIQADIHNIDAVALWLIRKPETFGVIVAENMFADIISDLGAGVMGGLGLAPSANVGFNNNYFEPVHGSAPNIKPNKANPSAMFLTVALLLEHFNYNKQANKIKNAVKYIINNSKSVTYDLQGSATTRQMADAIINKIK